MMSGHRNMDFEVGNPGSDLCLALSNCGDFDQGV